MKKKSELALNYTFLLFIGTITCLVILTLITSWAMKSDNFFSRLFKNDEDVINDVQIVNISSTDCNVLFSEIVKLSKLCYTKSKEGLIKADLCYAILNPGICTISVPDLESELSLIDSKDIADISNNKKIIISYNLEKKVLKIY